MFCWKSLRICANDFHSAHAEGSPKFPLEFPTRENSLLMGKDAFVRDVLVGDDAGKQFKKGVANVRFLR